MPADIVSLELVVIALAFCAPSPETHEFPRKSVNNETAFAGDRSLRTLNNTFMCSTAR
jgi:hypothetical protein